MVLVDSSVCIEPKIMQLPIRSERYNDYADYVLTLKALYPVLWEDVDTIRPNIIRSN